MRYIGLLRAVNVGGKNTIPMADLRSALQDIELDHVRTYIQSGNMVFDSDLTEDAVQDRIEHQIQQRFGFHIDVILRTVTEFDRLIADLPFAGASEPASSASSPVGVSVAFLNEPPDPDAVAALDRYPSPGEQYRVVSRNVYLLLPNGTARSKLVAQVQKLGPRVTVRNWKTVQKLQAMAAADQNDT